MFDLTPFIPLVSLKGEGKGKIKEGYRPLKLPTEGKEQFWRLCLLAYVDG